MPKRRFEVGPTPKTDHPMFQKFGMGDTDEEAKSLIGGDADPVGNAGGDAIGGGKDLRAKPSTAARSKAEPVKRKSGQATTDGVAAGKKDAAFIRVQIRTGVPKAFAPRLAEICAAGGITEDYALKWLSDQAVSGMDKVDIATIAVSPAGLKIAGRAGQRTVLTESSLIDQFRATHDPLDAYSVEECLSHIYVAAFSTALDELAKRLKK